MTGLFERGRAEEELDWREREPCGYSTCCKGRGPYVTSRLLGKARPAYLRGFVVVDRNAGEYSLQ